MFFKNLLRYRNSAREAEYPDIGHYTDNHFLFFTAFYLQLGVFYFLLKRRKCEEAISSIFYAISLMCECDNEQIPTDF